MLVERAWYESSPYLYAATGIVATLNDPGPLLMKASGLVLLAAATTIVGLRWIYRRDAGARAGTTSTGTTSRW